MTNKTKPTAIRAEECNLSPASPNSLAIKLDIVLPGANKFGVILIVLPISIVTAIVSPITLLKDNINPAKIPERAYGKIILKMTSKRVLPKAYAASFKDCGHMAMTSFPRVHENGIIIKERTIIADKKLTPEGVKEKKL